MDHIQIKYLFGVTKVLCSLIVPIIKEGDCYDTWKFVAHQCVNGSSQTQGVDFDNYYSTVAHSDSFRINIAISAMNRITARIFDFRNDTQDKNVLIYESVCVIQPLYYLEWLERYYTNVTINCDGGPFFL